MVYCSFQASARPQFEQRRIRCENPAKSQCDSNFCWSTVVDEPNNVPGLLAKAVLVKRNFSTNYKCVYTEDSLTHTNPAGASSTKVVPCFWNQQLTTSFVPISMARDVSSLVARTPLTRRFQMVQPEHKKAFHVPTPYARVSHVFEIFDLKKFISKSNCINLSHKAESFATKVSLVPYK